MTGGVKGHVWDIYGFWRTMQVAHAYTYERLHLLPVVMLRRGIDEWYEIQRMINQQ